MLSNSTMNGADVFITFYSKSKNSLHICNGFSFGREKFKRGYDLFFESDCSPQTIARAIKKIPERIGRIFCSISYTKNFNAIKPIVSDKWIIGGPFAAYLTRANIDIPATIVPGSLESFMGDKELSSDFSFYFEKFLGHENAEYINYTCSIGKGCYWNKCIFCDYKLFDLRKNLRPDIEGILKQIPPNHTGKSLVHLCIPTAPAKAMKGILESKTKKNVTLASFVRADESIIEVFREYNGQQCKDKIFVIGVESLSQSIINRLNKGFKIDNALELTRRILDLGGSVEYSIMDHYPIANRKTVLETLITMDRLKKIVGKSRRDRVWFYNNGITLWPNENVVSKIADRYNRIDYDPPEFGSRYIAVVDENSSEFECNREMSKAMFYSGFEVKGEPFISLKSSADLKQDSRSRLDIT